MRRNYFLSCILYKAINFDQCQLFRNELIFLQPMLRRGDVRQDYLRLPASHLAFYDKSFIVSAIRVWNTLPPNLTNFDTFNEFRSAAFNYFRSLESII
ncbi:Protein of unknown function [Cotesia congregata]|uniref:Uncharacterized protein n=1 Tax=Cotesia congregata TaxID=51543 RepID=A0A8J2HMS4_COTCN|nr:Protein of unknown function [Cotesia congregata]